MAITTLIQKNITKPISIFSCRWGAIHSIIDDLFICPPKYYFSSISLVGYTLFLSFLKRNAVLDMNSGLSLKVNLD